MRQEQGYVDLLVGRAATREQAQAVLNAQALADTPPPPLDVPFSTITPGTATLGALVVGTGASLGCSGTGTIDANMLVGHAIFGTPTDEQAIAWNAANNRWEPTAFLGTRVPVFVPQTCIHRLEALEVLDTGGAQGIHFVDAAAGFNGSWIYSSGANQLNVYFDSGVGVFKVWGGSLELPNGDFFCVNLRGSTVGVGDNSGFALAMFESNAAGDVLIKTGVPGSPGSYRPQWTLVDGANSRVRKADAVEFQGKAIQAGAANGDTHYYSGSAWNVNGAFKQDATHVAFFGAALAAQQAMGAALASRTASGTYGGTEQTMLQEAHDRTRTILAALRAYGLTS